MFAIPEPQIGGTVCSTPNKQKSLPTCASKVTKTGTQIFADPANTSPIELLQEWHVGEPKAFTIHTRLQAIGRIARTPFPNKATIIYGTPPDI